MVVNQWLCEENIDSNLTPFFRVCRLDFYTSFRTRLPRGTLKTKRCLQDAGGGKGDVGAAKRGNAGGGGAQAMKYYLSSKRPNHRAFARSVHLNIRLRIDYGGYWKRSSGKCAQGHRGSFRGGKINSFIIFYYANAVCPRW